MTVQTYRCNQEDCKGYLSFDDAEFNALELCDKEGDQVYAHPHCTGCGKEYRVVPHYAVATVNQSGVENIERLKRAGAWELVLHEALKKLEQTDDPYEKMAIYINYRGYTYSVEDVKAGYIDHLNGAYISHSMEDCVRQLEGYLGKHQLKF